jgi:hypothetical protein
MQLIHKIPLSLLLVQVVFGLLLFAGFRLYQRLILPIVLRRDSGAAHRKSIYRLEIMVWAVYFAFVIYSALVRSLPVTAILLALIVFAFFDFWRNYFPGIILKFGDKLQVGDSIAVNGYAGKILEFGNRDLKIISQEGEEMLIPYSRINTELKIGQKSSPKILYKTLVLEEAQSRQQIEKALYHNPWIIISSPVSIAFEERQAILSFYVLNHDFFEKARRHLLQELGR